MAVKTFTGKEIHSRVLQAVPDLSENYVLNLINQALLDIGQHSSSHSNAKTNLNHNQLWYALNDAEGIGINKIYRCSIKNKDGEYIMIPRLTPSQIKQFYNESIADSKTNTSWTEL
jgi:hypothetical protein|tara:strand:- start:691 stop:1038 length:348 start_codon:yes stop_codon:yes gene_type:complete